MSAISELRAADALLFDDGISFTLNIPTRPPSRQNTGRQCIPKRDLEFQLRIPEPALTIEFRGTPDATGTLVTWRVDQPLDAWYEGVHITHVRGQMVTRLSEVTASLAQNCDREERLVRVTLETTGADNTLTVSTPIGGVTLTDITASGRAAEAVPAVVFGVRVEADGVQRDGCGGSVLLRGSTVTFTALTHHLRTVGTTASVTYTWTIAGRGTVVGADNEQNLTVVLNDSDHIEVGVEVTVRTDIHSGTHPGRAEYEVVTEEELENRRMWCRFHARLQSLIWRPVVVELPGVGPGFTINGIRYVDPLFDPPPDFLRGVFAFKLRLFRDEMRTLHSRIASFDTLSFQVKGWAAALWAGLAGYAIAQDKPLVAVAAVPLMLVFWALDSYLTGYQDRARARMGVMNQYLDRPAKAPEPSLARAFSEQSFGEFVIHDPGAFRAALLNNAYLVYAVLAGVSFAIFAFLRG